MRRGRFRDRALVVRTYDFNEADRIVVLLTAHRGVVRAVAKGVRRARSRFGSRVQRFVLLDVECYQGQRLATLTSADTVRYFGSGIIDDYERYSAACAVLETAERLSLAELEDPELFELTVAALERIQPSGEPTVELDRFVLHALAHSGWLPSMFHCAQCGKPGPHRGFDSGAGGAVCSECRPPGTAQVPADALRFMWWLAHDHDSAVEQLQQQNPAHFIELAGVVHRLVSAYVQYQLERAVLSLRAQH